MKNETTSDPYETVESQSYKQQTRKLIQHEITTRGLSCNGGEIPYKLLPPQKAIRKDIIGDNDSEAYEDIFSTLDLGYQHDGINMTIFPTYRIKKQRADNE